MLHGDIRAAHVRQNIASLFCNSDLGNLVPVSRKIAGEFVGAAVRTRIRSAEAKVNDSVRAHLVVEYGRRRRECRPGFPDIAAREQERRRHLPRESIVTARDRNPQ
jgi:hypothetical protein